MNILKTLLLVFGISFLVSACAEDTIGDNGSSAGLVDTRPTLEGPYIGDNSTYGNGSQDYSYMKELETKPNYANGTSGHPMLENYFNRGHHYYSSIHNNWFDWTQKDVHGEVENNIQIVPDMGGTNPTKNGVRFPHSYHQDIARYTDLIGNCTTNCHTRFINAQTKPYNVAPPCAQGAEPGDPSCNPTKSKIVFASKVQVGDSSYNNPAHNFCWTCHANLPKPARAPHGFIVTTNADGTTTSHQPNGNCSNCHYWTFGSISEPGHGDLANVLDGQAKADANFYGRPDVRENHFGNKADLPAGTFVYETAHKYPDADNNTEIDGGAFKYDNETPSNNPAPQFTPPAGN